MKNKFKTMMPLITAFGVSLVALNANASDGTINFIGKVTASTCDISINGSGADAIITLPTVSTNVLSAVGDTAGRTNFTMELTNCSPASGNVFSYFESGADVDAASGRLTNNLTADNSTGVDLQLLDSDAAPIKVGDSSQMTDSEQVAIDTGTASATLNYAVEYYATAAATAGDLASTVTYSISYM
ncbi:fimbrial protein [Vibrio owensii]|uniref:fimbrial protein n=1 Tax=Vibrio owensii TaxID=696485 RepID=UPI000B0D12D8|nr:fimbrial protein [Vibrio owensii]SUP39624.1 fimbrial protein [Vibrio owensii]